MEHSLFRLIHLFSVSVLQRQLFLCFVHLFLFSALVERHLAVSAILRISALATANKVKSGFSKTFKEKTFSIWLKKKSTSSNFEKKKGSSRWIESSRVVRHKMTNCVTTVCNCVCWLHQMLVIWCQSLSVCLSVFLFAKRIDTRVLSFKLQPVALNSFCFCFFFVTKTFRPPKTCLLFLFLSLSIFLSFLLSSCLSFLLYISPFLSTFFSFFFSVFLFLFCSLPAFRSYFLFLFFLLSLSSFLSSPFPFSKLFCLSLSSCFPLSSPAPLYLRQTTFPLFAPSFSAPPPLPVCLDNAMTSQPCVISCWEDTDDNKSTCLVMIFFFATGLKRVWIFEYLAQTVSFSTLEINIRTAGEKLAFSFTEWSICLNH